MFDPHIDLGQMLILGGGAAAFISSMAVTRARQEDMRTEMKTFQDQVNKNITDLKNEVKSDLNAHGAAIFTMSGQVQRIIGALGAGPLRSTDVHHT